MPATLRIYRIRRRWEKKKGKQDVFSFFLIYIFVLAHEKA